MSQTEQARDSSAAMRRLARRSAGRGTRVDTAHLRAGRRRGALKLPPRPPVESAARRHRAASPLASRATGGASAAAASRDRSSRGGAQRPQRGDGEPGPQRAAVAQRTARRSCRTSRPSWIAAKTKSHSAKPNWCLQAKPVAQVSQTAPPATPTALADRARSSTAAKPNSTRWPDDWPNDSPCRANRGYAAGSAHPGKAPTKTWTAPSSCSPSNRPNSSGQRQQFAEERATFAEQSQADRQRLAHEQQRAIAEHDKVAARAEAARR